MYRTLVIAAASLLCLPALADEAPIDTEFETVASVNNLLRGTQDTILVTHDDEVFHYDVYGELLASYAFEGPVGCLAVAPNGDLFVSVTNNHRVSQYSAEGEWLADYEYEGAVTGLVVTEGGWVMVSVTNNHRVVGSEVMGVIETNG